MDNLAASIAKMAIDSNYTIVCQSRTITMRPPSSHEQTRAIVLQSSSEQSHDKCTCDMKDKVNMSLDEIIDKLCGYCKAKHYISEQWRYVHSDVIGDDYGD